MQRFIFSELPRLRRLRGHGVDTTGLPPGDRAALQRDLIRFNKQTGGWGITSNHPGVPRVAVEVRNAAPKLKIQKAANLPLPNSYMRHGQTIKSFYTRLTSSLLRAILRKDLANAVVSATAFHPNRPH